MSDTPAPATERGSASCRFCGAELAATVEKCKACGEWRDGRRVLSGAGKLCLGLLSVELSALAALVLLWVPTARELLKEMGSGPLPLLTRFVLSTGWPVAWLVVVAGLVGAALLAVERSRARDTLLVIAVVVGALAPVVTWCGLELPIWQLADAIR